MTKSAELRLKVQNKRYKSKKSLFTDGMVSKITTGLVALNVVLVVFVILFLSSLYFPMVTDLEGIKNELGIMTVEREQAISEVSDATFLILAKPISQNTKAVSNIYVDSEGVGWNTGTGFAISNDGVLLTAKHVIEGKTEFKVLKNGKEIGIVEGVASFPDADMAVIKLNANTPKVKLKSFGEALKVGSEVAFVGYPLGKENLIFHEGVVSGRSGENNSTKMYTVNAFVNSGNSGSPLFNPNNGEVVGIVFAREYQKPISPIIDVNMDNVSSDTQKILAMQQIILAQVVENSQVGIGYTLALNETVLDASKTMLEASGIN